MTFFAVVYRKNIHIYLKDKVTIAQWETIPNIWNGTMFVDVDWPVNASRRFVSISWASCYPCDAVSVGNSYGNVAGWVAAGWLGGWLSVCHSRYCIKTTKPILKLFRPPDSPIIEAFGTPAPIRNSKGNPFIGGVKYTGWVGKLAIFVRFSTDIAVYLGNGAR